MLGIAPSSKLFELDKKFLLNRRYAVLRFEWDIMEIEVESSKTKGKHYIFSAVVRIKVAY